MQTWRCGDAEAAIAACQRVHALLDQTRLGHPAALKVIHWATDTDRELSLA
jgi:hypothetical protein